MNALYEFDDAGYGPARAAGVRDRSDGLEAPDPIRDRQEADHRALIVCVSSLGRPFRSAMRNSPDTVTARAANRRLLTIDRRFARAAEVIGSGLGPVGITDPLDGLLRIPLPGMLRQ